MAKARKSKKKSVADGALARKSRKSKGRKSRKSEKVPAEPIEEKGRKSSKGRKSKGGKGRKSGKGKKSVMESMQLPAVKETGPSVATSEPEPEPVSKCNDLIKTDGPCRYTEDACCVEAVLCRPNSYPGMLDEPQTMAVVGSECGTYTSLCKLIRAGLRCADRVFTMTPWGNYVIFRCHNGDNKVYFLFDGCTCNVNRFRYLDLSHGTAGLLYFEDMHKLICYILESRQLRARFKHIRKNIIDDICREFCEYGGRH